MEIKIITHYAEDDLEFVSDHIGGEVVIDGETIFVFPDAYHDRDTYVDGFIAGIEWYLEKYGNAENMEIEHIGIADGKQVW